MAESLFWLGRYVDRAENTARLLDVTYHGRLEPYASQMVGASNTWQALVATLGLEDEYAAVYGEPTEANVIEFLTVSRHPCSILSSLTAARENARGVRDYLSSEIWVAINRLYHASSRANVHLIMADGLYDFCDTVRQGTQLFHGTVESTALHDEGWHWLQSGVLLERADMVTRLVDSKYHLLMLSLEEVGGALDRYQWAAVLRSISGYEAFRRTHAEGIDAGAVAEFLLLDQRFPRSLRASIDDLRHALDQATEGADPKLRNPIMLLASGIQAQLQFQSIDMLLVAGLHEFITETQSQLAELTASVGASFFWAPSAA